MVNDYMLIPSKISIRSAQFSPILSVNTAGLCTSSFNPNGSTAFTSSLCLLRNITSLFTVLYSHCNSFTSFAVRLMLPGVRYIVRTARCSAHHSLNWIFTSSVVKTSFPFSGSIWKPSTGTAPPAIYLTSRWPF